MFLDLRTRPDLRSVLGKNAVHPESDFFRLAESFLA